MTVSVLGIEQFEGTADSLSIDTEALASAYGMVELDRFLLCVRSTFTRLGGQGLLTASPNDSGGMHSLGVANQTASTDDFDFDFQSGSAGAGEGVVAHRLFDFPYYPTDTIWDTLTFTPSNADLYVVCDVVMLRTSLVDSDVDLAYTGYMDGRGQGHVTPNSGISTGDAKEPIGLGIGYTDAEGFGAPGWPDGSSTGAAVVFTTFNADRDPDDHASETRLGSSVVSTRWMDPGNTFAGQDDKGYGCGTYIATGIGLGASGAYSSATPNRTATDGYNPTVSGTKHWSGEFITKVGPLLDAANTHRIGYLTSTVVFSETLPTSEPPEPTRRWWVGVVGWGSQGSGEG